MRTARPIRTSKSLDRDGQDPLLPAPKKRKHSDQWWWLSLRNETGSTAMYLLQDQYYCDREKSINHAKYIRSLESHAAHARKNDKIYQKWIAKRYTRYLQRCLINSDKFTWLNATQTWSVGGRIRNSSSWLLAQFREVVGLTNKFLQKRPSHRIDQITSSDLPQSCLWNLITAKNFLVHREKRCSQSCGLKIMRNFSNPCSWMRCK
jgi:hypothetical protein